MKKSTQATRALLAALADGAVEPTVLAARAYDAHLEVAQLWTLAEADVARKRSA